MDPFTDLRKTILNNIPDQAWLKDRNSSYIAVNEAFVAACGLTEAEILNRTPRDIWPIAWGRKYIRTDREVVRTGRRSHYEETRFTHDGGWRWFDTIKTPILDADGTVIGTAGISRDITERKRSEQALSSINRLYAIRSEISRAIVRAASREQLLERVCRIAVEAGGFSLAWIGLASGGTLTPVAGFGRQAVLRRTGGHALSLLGGVDTGALWRDALRFAHYDCDAGSAEAHARWAATQGLAGYAVLPLRQAGRRIGLLLVYARKLGFFSADIEQLLRALSKDLSFALDSFLESERRTRAERDLRESRAQLRELSAFLQSVREEERTRISRELHDELGQSLTALQIGLGVIEHRRMPAAERQQQVRALQRIADDTVRTVQRLATELRPPILDALGLVPAIDWLIESMAERTGLVFEFVHPPQMPALGHEASTALFRIAQESLTNACRHGHARHVGVTLRLGGGQACLEVIDDGQGMAPAPPAGRRTLGLVGMRERALMLGGTLHIETAPGTGTRVVATLPQAALAPGSHS